MNRGARRYDTFISDDDRRLFLRLVRDAMEAADIELVAYCLMPNHYHLVLGCPRGGLSRSVQAFSANYTRAFNRRHGFDGPLFRSRFRSVSVTSDDHLLNVTRYVHRNPLEIGANILQYPWSSYRNYGTSAPPSPPGRIDPVPALAGGTTAYRHFVETDRPSDDAPLAAGTRTIVETGRGSGSLPFALVEAAVTSVTGVGPEDLRRPSYGRGPDATARLLVVLLACEAGSWSVGSIADHFGFTTPGSVRSALSRARSRLVNDPAFGRQADRAQATLSATVSDTVALR